MSKDSSDTTLLLDETPGDDWKDSFCGRPDGAIGRVAFETAVLDEEPATNSAHSSRWPPTKSLSGTAQTRTQ